MSFDTTKTVKAFFDGGARGNNTRETIRDCRICVVFQQGNLETKIGPEASDVNTNNEAEWMALCRLLSEARDKGFKKLDIFGDSKLVVNQFNRSWRCKAEHLKPFLEMALDYRQFFDELTVTWRGRDFNPAGWELDKK